MKYIFVWYNVENVTHNYHSNACIVAIASRLSDVKEMVEKKRIEQARKERDYLSDEEFNEYVSFKDFELGEPADVDEVKDTTLDCVYIFPDAGCC